MRKKNLVQKEYKSMRIDTATYAKLEAVAGWEGEPIAFHNRRAIEKYHAEKVALRASNKGRRDVADDMATRARK